MSLKITIPITHNIFDEEINPIKEEKIPISIRTTLYNNKVFNTNTKDVYNTLYNNLSLNKNSTIYEIINGECKPYADIDISGFNTKKEMTQKRVNIISKIKERFQDNQVFYILDSSGKKNSSWTVSLHIIFDGVKVLSGKHCEKLIEDWFAGICLFDQAVYKSAGLTQLFRMAYTTKETDTPRFLKLVNLMEEGFPLIEFKDINPQIFGRLAISNTKGCKLIEQALTTGDPGATAFEPQELPHGLVGDLLEIIARNPDNYTSFVKWKKIGLTCASLGDCETEWHWFSSQCVSKYNHGESEKLYKTLLNQGTYTIATLYYEAGFVDDQATQQIRLKYRPTTTDQISKKEHIENIIKQGKVNITNSKEPERLKQKAGGIITEYYNERWVKPFDGFKEDTLFVRSAKGTGKSFQFEKYIKNMKEKNQGEYVLFITFRTSLAWELYKRMDNFEHYKLVDWSDKEKIKDMKNLILQVESLHKNRWRKCDILILDEYNSLEHQLFSKETQRGKMAQNINKFRALVKEAKKVIITDADLGMEQINNINKFRSPRNERSSRFIVNEYKPKSNVRCNIYLNQYHILNDISSDVEQHMKVIVATNKSKRFSETMKRLLEQKFPHKRILLINSETSREPKIQNIIKNIENPECGWEKYDVVIYSPTLQAGVSFNKPHFQKFYGLFSDHMPVNATRQMIDRCRQFEANEFNYYISTIGGSCIPTNRKDLEQFIKKRRTFDTQQLEVPEIVPYNENLTGEINYPLKDEIYEMWINTLLQKARDRAFFIKNFIEAEMRTGINDIQIIDKPRGIPVFQNENGKSDEKLKAVVKETIATIKEENIKKLVNSQQITEQQAVEIIKNMEKGEQVEESKIQSIKMYNLKNKYNLLQDRTLTEKQTKILLDKTNFKNLNNIDLLKQALKETQGDIQLAFKWIADKEKQRQNWNQARDGLIQMGIVKIIEDTAFVVKGQFDGREMEMLDDGDLERLYEEFPEAGKFRCAITDMMNFQNYKNQLHQTCYKIVRKFGFKDVFDKESKIEYDEIEKKFKKGDIIKQDEIDEVAMLWGCPKRRIPKREEMDMRKLLKFINGKIKPFYGISIKREKKKSKYIILHFNKNIDYTKGEIKI